MLAGAACLVLASASFAQEAQPNDNTIGDIPAAQILIANGRLDDARKLLAHSLETHPEDSQTLFLLATLATAQQDYETAISLYRHILANEPDAERVRLELARVFFLKGDYENADRQFRFARAGDIPDSAKQNIDHFLSAINRLRDWTVNFSLAIAPDTNENAATDTSQILVYGLPFALDPGARRQSGVGLAADIGGEWSPLLFDNVKARIGADAYRVDYSGAQFDDMTISTYAGPQLLFSNWDMSVLVTDFHRWYGGQPYLDGFGGRLTGDYGITSDVLISGSVGLQNVSYKLVPEQGGPLFSSQLQASYVLSPSSLFQLQMGFNRQDAGADVYSYTGVWFAAAYQQDLPFGFSAGIQPSLFLTGYDAALAAFGVRRRDQAETLSLNILNRRLDYHGFTPRFSYTFTNQQSDIALYRYSRNQFQIGITSQF
jgi:Tfp pilus assembly protein PilF